MDAKKAREVAETNLMILIDSQKRNILKEINAAAKAGDFSIVVDKPLYSTVRIALSELGYSMYTSSGYTRISW